MGQSWEQEYNPGATVTEVSTQEPEYEATLPGVVSSGAWNGAGLNGIERNRTE